MAEVLEIATGALEDQVNAYLTAFNQMDLDAVMTYFAAQATYEPGDGTTFRGVEAIRQAFRPQFARAYGSMYFEEEDRLIDSSTRCVMLSWVCHIDGRTAKFFSLGTWLRISLGRLRFGNYVRWKGLDLLYFNTEGKITRKLTYANYAGLKLQRDANPVSGR